MIRQFDRVNYTPVRGAKPTIENAEIYRLDIPNQCALLVGYTNRSFPLKFLTRTKSIKFK